MFLYLVKEVTEKKLYNGMISMDHSGICSSCQKICMIECYYFNWLQSKVLDSITQWLSALFLPQQLVEESQSSSNF